MRTTEVEVRRAGSGIITSPDPNPVLLAHVEVGEVCWVSVLGDVSTRYVGPVTAVVEIDQGGNSLHAEVDVPIRTASSDGGCMICVPGRKFRVYVRDDGNLVTPSVDLSGRGMSFGIPSGASGGGYSGMMHPGGRNIPWGAGSWCFLHDEKSWLFSVMAKVGPWPSGDLEAGHTRTIRVYSSLPEDAVHVSSGSRARDEGGGPALYFTPMFAKAVTVSRFPRWGFVDQGAVVLSLYDQLGDVDRPASTRVVASDKNSIVLRNEVMMVGVETSGVPVKSLALIFDVGI